MKIQDFLKQSGCKVLAVAGLTDCEYSLVLYLLNCALSGLDDLITTEAELAAILRYDIKFIREGLSNLADYNIIHLHYGDLTQKPKVQSFRIGMQFDIDQWKLVWEKGKEEDSQAAVIFPFRRGGQFKLVEGSRGKKKSKSQADEETWRRVLESFERDHELSDAERKRSEQIARTLVETHPVDQILILIRHFGTRIPTLSLLASSWNHFSSAYEDESQKVDLLEARHKHQELDQKLRDLAKSFLDRRHELDLSEDEIAVLEVLMTHRYPRRQLFWAFQLRLRYPKLATFFVDSSEWMLPSGK